MEAAITIVSFIIGVILGVTMAMPMGDVKDKCLNVLRKYFPNAPLDYLERVAEHIEDEITG